MKNYRRILVPIAADGQGEILLQRAADIAKTQGAQMLVVRVLDSRTGFESDGPAGGLPAERAARRLPAARKRLDLLLARTNLAWAETKVVCGEPEVALADVIGNWRPDLVVACTGHLPPGVAADTDLLTVACRSLFRRLAEAWHHPVLEQPELARLKN